LTAITFKCKYCNNKAVSKIPDGIKKQLCDMCLGDYFSDMGYLHLDEEL